LTGSTNPPFTSPQRGLPGLCGLDHVGFTVPDIEKAVRFFVDILGCEHFYDLGPFGSDDDWMAEHLNVHPRAIVRKLAFLRCGSGPSFEIFEYEAPDRRLEQPRNSDIGGHHLAFYVQDFSAGIDYLRKNNIQILGEPTVRTVGPSGGQTWVYFLTPWGMQCELVSYPAGKGYEQTTSRRLWHPAFPER
jgi:catechol 2,3-dioxygenase-like lactoylglutathione lyase family enzyme